MWKRILSVVVVLLILVGGVWFFQGLGLLPGRLMSGQPQWAVNGVIAMIIGGVTLFFANRRQVQKP